MGSVKVLRGDSLWETPNWGWKKRLRFQPLFYVLTSRIAILGEITGRLGWLEIYGKDASDAEEQLRCSWRYDRARGFHWSSAGALGR